MNRKRASLYTPHIPASRVDAFLSPSPHQNLPRNAQIAFGRYKGNGKSKCDFLVLSGDKWREKNFCLVTNPRKKLKYRMFTEAES